MSEREHIALNNYFRDKQNPREQLKEANKLASREEKGVAYAGGY